MNSVSRERDAGVPPVGSWQELGSERRLPPSFSLSGERSPDSRANAAVERERKRNEGGEASGDVGWGEEEEVGRLR